MSEPEHTPGPWKYRGPTFGAYHVKASCTPAGETWQFPLCSGIGSEADARLIGAAPDYFEGVEMMESANRRDDLEGWWEGFRKLKAAHAKAKGGTP